MPQNATLKARLPKWNIVLDALRYYRAHFDERLRGPDDEGEDYLLVYDDLNRLARIIPNFEKQIKGFPIKPPRSCLNRPHYRQCGIISLDG